MKNNSLRCLFKCHGGKSYLKWWIIGFFPKNYTQLTYVEGCGGAASILLNKQKSIKEVYNDIDPKIVSIVREFADKEPKEFIDLILKTEYKYDSFQWALNHQSEDAKLNAVAELVKRRMSRGGLGKAFSWSNRHRGGRPGEINSWETYKEQVWEIADRLKNVEVQCKSINNLIDSFENENTLFYIDPPYLPETRQAKKVYNFEMTEEEHIALGEKLNKTLAKVILSGYQSQLYAKLYKNWNMQCISIANHSSQTEIKQKRIEVLWMNY